MKLSLSLGFAGKVTLASLIAWFGIVAACSPAPDSGSRNRPGSGSGSGGNGSGSGGFVGNAGTIGPIDIPDSGAADARATRCDDAGNCTCINVLVYGRLPTYGAGGPGTDTTIAFQNYLNTRSSAEVSIITTYTPLTPEFLANYDVIILQALEDRENGPYWQFTAEELANFETWVRNGGGVISLMGYGASAAEVNPTNQLLSFTGLSYATDDVLGDNCPAPAPGNCCFCAPTSYPLQGWNGSHPISREIQRVGAFHGRSVISTASDAQIVAQGPLNFQPGAGMVVYGGTRQIDLGRVFLFTDEWVTYTSQWGQQLPAGIDMGACVTDMNNPCHGTTANVYYQVPQFWFNSLLWISGDRECFTIDDPVIVK